VRWNAAVHACAPAHVHLQLRSGKRPPGSAREPTGPVAVRALDHPASVAGLALGPVLIHPAGPARGPPEPREHLCRLGVHRHRPHSPVMRPSARALLMTGSRTPRWGSSLAPLARPCSASWWDRCISTAIRSADHAAGPSLTRRRPRASSATESPGSTGVAAAKLDEAQGRAGRRAEADVVRRDAHGRAQVRADRLDVRAVKDDLRSLGHPRSLAPDCVGDGRQRGASASSRRRSAPAPTIRAASPWSSATNRLEPRRQRTPPASVAQRVEPALQRVEPFLDHGRHRLSHRHALQVALIVSASRRSRDGRSARGGTAISCANSRSVFWHAAG
jgi:hypothetical protein